MLFFRLISQSKWRYYFLFGLIFKLICGIALGLLYTWLYDGGDTFGYFQRASTIANLDWQSFWSNIFEPVSYSLPVRRVYFDRVLAIVLYFSKTDYWMASFYFSFFSFTCAAYLVRQVIYWKPKWSKAAMFSFLFYPSMDKIKS